MYHRQLRHAQQLYFEISVSESELPGSTASFESKYCAYRETNLHLRGASHMEDPCIHKKQI